MFKRMFASLLIEILYSLGALFITLGGLYALVTFAVFTPISEEYTMSNATFRIIATVLVTITINIVWRVMMEGSIVIFRIYEELVDVRKLLEKENR